MSERQWPANLAALLCGLLIATGSAELLLRLFDPGDNVRATASLDIYRSSACCNLALRPNLLRATFWNGKKVIIRTDGQGYRIPHKVGSEIPKQAKSVLFAGDSYTFGNEENAVDTFPFLATRGSDLRSVNLGVGSYSTHQAVASLAEYIRNNGANGIGQVVLVFFVGNDFADNTPNREMLELDAQGRIRFAETGAPEWIRQLVFDSRLLSFVVLRLRTLYLNLAYHLTSANTPTLYSAEYFSAELLAHTRRGLADFRKLCQVHALTGLVVIVPDKDQIYKPFASPEARHRPNRELIKLLMQLEIPYVDLLPVFLAGGGDPLYNMTPNGHLSAEGHRQVADILSESLLR